MDEQGPVSLALWPAQVSKVNPVSGEDTHLLFSVTSTRLSTPSPDAASFGKPFLLSSQASLKV